jgi:hypothetical protein
MSKSGARSESLDIIQSISAKAALVAQPCVSALIETDLTVPKVRNGTEFSKPGATSLDAYKRANMEEKTNQKAPERQNRRPGVRNDPSILPTSVLSKAGFW